MAAHTHTFAGPTDALPDLRVNGHRGLADKLATLTVYRCADCGAGKVRARAKPGVGLTPAQRQTALRLAIEM